MRYNYITLLYSYIESIERLNHLLVLYVRNFYGVYLVIFTMGGGRKISDAHLVKFTTPPNMDI